jgi:large subunit ribosomal protein L15
LVKKRKLSVGALVQIYRRLPKRGFKTPNFSYQIINLARLEKDEKITSGQILDFSKEKLPVKILGEGEITKKLTIKAAAFSHSAQVKITQGGGEWQIVAKNN